METKAEIRRREMLNLFFNKFQRIPTPICYECKKHVEKFTIDAEPHDGWLIATCSCHGDMTEYKIKFYDAMKFNNLVISVAFRPGSATRVNGKLVSDMTPTNTRKYDGIEPVTDEEKRDILEIPKDKPLGGYAS